MTRAEFVAGVVAAYPDPQPWLTAEGFARAGHDDIATLGDEDLDRERYRATFRWAYDDEPSDWLIERRTLLEAEATARVQRRRARR